MPQYVCGHLVLIACVYTVTYQPSCWICHSTCVDIYHTERCCGSNIHRCVPCRRDRFATHMQLLPEPAFQEKSRTTATIYGIPGCRCACDKIFACGSTVYTVLDKQCERGNINYVTNNIRCSHGSGNKDSFADAQKTHVHKSLAD